MELTFFPRYMCSMILFSVLYEFVCCVVKMAENITKEELEKEIAKILENANLAQTSTKKVRQRLEEKFGVELTEKRKLIDQLVMEYVNSKEEPEDADDDNDPLNSEEEASEEEVKKPAKRAAAKKAPAKKRKVASSEEDNDDDADSDDEPKKKTKKKAAAAKPAKGKKAASGGRGKGSGYTRAIKLSPALAELMGEDAMPRHEVVKRMWALIKQRELFDPNNKQFAICDDQLYKVIGSKRFRTFGMMKYLKNHFIDD